MPKAKIVPKIETKAVAPEKTAILAKVIFEANVNGFKITDELRLRAGTLKEAKEIFMMWVAKSIGIKGDSNIFHPLSGYGDIKIKEVRELQTYAKSSKDDSKGSEGEIPSGSHD